MLTGKTGLMELPGADRVPKRVLRAMELLRSDGSLAYVVGGAVRDMMIKGDSDDWDVATSALPDRVKQLFPRNAAMGERHGSVMAISDDGTVDITTFRTEGAYSDSRRPDEVHFVNSIEDDLSRRDFTINAMAWDPSSGELVDPFGGKADLEAGIIRTVGSPDERFSEDALRMLRAFRFASTLCFAIEEETLSAIGRHSFLISMVSGERKALEIGRMMKGKCASSALCGFVESNLAEQCFPSSDKKGMETAARYIGELPERPLLRLSAFLACGDPKGPHRVDGTIRQRMDELKMPRTAKAHAAVLTESLYGGYGLSDGPSIRKWAALLGRDALEDGIAIRSWYDRFIRGKKDWQEDVERIGATLAENPPLSKEDMAIRGSDVVNLLGGPGPKVKALLNRLYLDVLDSPELNDKEKLMLLALLYIKGDEGGGVVQ